jgi:serine phosphatase RsbU (regulator of sigma subunit)
MNRGRQEFGEERLLEWTARVAGPSVGAIRQELLERVGEFTRSAPQHDDITLVTVRALQ